MSRPVEYSIPMDVERLDDEAKLLMALEVFLSIHATSIKKPAVARALQYLFHKYNVDG